VAAFPFNAHAIVARLRATGQVPVLVGGSALYVRAVLDELSFPGTDPLVRQRLEQELARVGPAVLHQRLAELDPAASGAVLASNGRRIVRALEVIEITGRPFSAQLPELGEPRYDAVLLGLDLPTEALDQRIASRVRRMFSSGLVEEVRVLVEVGLRDGRTASRAVGYQQVLAALDDDTDLACAEADTVRATRRLVRRQRSWFRRDRRIRWLDGQGDSLASALEAIQSAGG
jgi:tRNA dimethylallyltransferase